MQAAFGAMNVPTERLGYTYLTCMAGGSLPLSDLEVASVEQFITPDRSNLTRVFTMRAVVTSTIIHDVVRRCAQQLEMNVRATSMCCLCHRHRHHRCRRRRPLFLCLLSHLILLLLHAACCVSVQPPRQPLPLPYSSVFNVTITVKEQWHSDGSTEAAASLRSEGNATPPQQAADGHVVSVRPFSQWTISAVSFHGKMTGQLGRFPLQQRAALMNMHRRVPDVAPLPDNAVHGEAWATCSMGSDLDVLRCANPLTMYVGEPAVLHTRLYQMRNGVRWFDRHSEL
jgi:hypothetical protein